MNLIFQYILLIIFFIPSIYLPNYQDSNENDAGLIIIDGDSELDQNAVTHGWSGNGTNLNPYVISGITESYSFINITKDVIIKNIMFTGSASPSNLYINNSSNFTINSCVFNNSDYGISINNCIRINIIYCTFYNFARSIISNNIDILTITNCSLKIYHERTGLQIRYGNFVNINNNSFVNGNNGISIMDTNKTYIYKNYFFNQSMRSISQRRIQSLFIINNTLESSSGMFSDYIGSFSIINNQISNKIHHNSFNDIAISINDCAYGQIENNIINILRGGIICISDISVEGEYALIRNNTIINGTTGILSNKCQVNNNRIINSSIGISTFGNSLINNNSLSNNNIALKVHLSEGNIISNNTALSFYDGIGIDIHNSDPITVKNLFLNNKISGFKYGIFFNGTVNGNILINNTILNSTISGIRMMNSDGQIIKGNVIQSSKEYGLEMQNSKSNTISDNVFLYNQGSKDQFNEETIQAIDYNGGNSFSEGGRGNYWRDLSGNDENSDGVIDDIDYILEGGTERDRYPLESPPFPVVSKIPLNLTVNGMNPFIEIEWEDGRKGHPFMVPEGYNIYRRIDGNEQFDLIKSTTDLKFHDHNVFSGTNYHYAISSFNEFGETPKCEYVIGIVDDRGPYLNIYEPWNGSVLSTENVTVKWTANDLIGKMKSIEIRLDGSDWINVSTEDQYTFTNLEEGPYRIYIRGRDEAGNEKITESNFTIDLNAPVCLSITPENNYFTNRTWIECKVTGYDNVSDQIHYTFNINGENRSVVNQEGIFNFTDLSEGKQIITVYIHDQVGFFIKRSVIYNIDLTPPELEWNTTMNLTREQGLDLTWTLTDQNAGISHVLVKGPDDIWRNSDDYKGHRFVSREEGTFTVLVEAFDKAGNHATIRKNITFDRTPANVMDYGPSGENVSIQAEFHVIFDENMNTCTWEVNDIKGGFEGVGRILEFTLDSPLKRDSSYTVTIKGNDPAGNNINPFTWTFNTTDWGIVSGKVLRNDRNPVHSAVIEIDDRIIQPDTDGSFQSVLHPGIYSIRITVDGFKQWNSTFAIEPGADKDLGTIILDPGSSALMITGKVFDNNEKPIHLVSIEKKGQILDTTNEKGTFSFEIEPGTHSIRFWKNGYETKTVTVDTNSFEGDPYLEVKLKKGNESEKEVNYLLIITITISTLIFVIILFSLLTRNRREEIEPEE